ncbi:hypothetical protein [Phytoactinopolyspora limicola]|uniref:hypothetical protein n=1 Tax=Phytoactinopolyspora limicola TaxID=2715536 RepID=UPI00140BF72A|nr:hypothetical protein [Phytoactinopolyspora limicola]
MIMRVWRTRIDDSRTTDYEQFAAQESLPMFRAHAGFAGLLFGRSGDECVVVTLWADAESVAAFEASQLYQETVDRITAAGFIVGPSFVERFEVHGSHLPGFDPLFP